MNELDNGNFFKRVKKRMGLKEVDMHKQKDAAKYCCWRSDPRAAQAVHRSSGLDFEQNIDMWAILLWMFSLAGITKLAVTGGSDGRRA